MFIIGLFRQYKGFKANSLTKVLLMFTIGKYKPRRFVLKTIPAQNNPILEFLDLDNDNDYDLIYGQITMDSVFLPRRAFL